jgi:cytochrome c oxidase subunit 3
MSTPASKQIDSATLWGGKVSPFSMGYGKIMMWFFLVSDALTFGGLLTSLGFAKFANPETAAEWPAAEKIFTHFPFTHEHLPLLYVALMTFILIVSSVTMVLAVEAGHRMDKKGVVKWLAFTVVGGIVFLGSQVWEWKTFIAGPDGDISTWADNATLAYNSYGPVQYADYFFFITGFHGFHVLTGVIFNIVILINAMNGTYERRGHYEMVEKVGLYWHFIDLVWVFVFTFYYLV